MGGGTEGTAGGGGMARHDDAAMATHAAQATRRRRLSHTGAGSRVRCLPEELWHTRLTNVDRLPQRSAAHTTRSTRTACHSLGLAPDTIHSITSYSLRPTSYGRRPTSYVLRPTSSSFSPCAGFSRWTVMHQPPMPEGAIPQALSGSSQPNPTFPTGPKPPRTLVP